MNLYPVTVEARVIGIGVIAVDISERKIAELARMKLTRAAVDTAAATIELRDPYTAGHQSRVAVLASAIAPLNWAWKSVKSKVSTLRHAFTT